ncbi:hypothetical protein GCM10020255_101800 [Rhodococcus baikonurensis]
MFDLPVEAVFSRTEFGPLSTEVYRSAQSTEVYRNAQSTEINRSHRTTEGVKSPVPESNLIDRYQAHRTRRFLQNEETFRHWLPNWRTRRRRRVLVVALGVLFTTMVVVGIACLFNPLFAVAWPIITVLFLPTWSSLQIVSGRQGMRRGTLWTNGRSSNATTPAPSG